MAKLASREPWRQRADATARSACSFGCRRVLPQAGKERRTRHTVRLGDKLSIVDTG